MDITLKLKLDEVNGVLQALAQMPYGQVFALIENIRNQTAPQLATDSQESNKPQVVQSPES